MDILKVKQNGVWTAIPAIIGPRGIGITSITKTGTSGLTDTYTITFSDNTTTTFTLNNGAVPNLTIGTVTEGATAAATITGTTDAPVLNLVLPNANVPTRVSELENDAGYLITETDPTVPAWAKAAQKPTYTAAEVGAPTVAEMQQAIANVNTMKIHICAQGEYNTETGVPTIQNPDTQTFYLVPGGEGSNLFIEWAYVNSAWERFGSADVDLSNYVQKTDYASRENIGIVGIISDNGIDIDGTSHRIFIKKATNDMIKAATSAYRPIVASNQHLATFYGLAKAAGDTTQSQSDNAVGTYTDAAKTAIQTMLDVPAKSDIPTKVSDLTDDSGHYTKPVGGIPASDLAAGVIPNVPVTDVQVNGVSVLSSGVANVGLMTGNAQCLTAVAGHLGVVSASSVLVKNGTSGINPIVPKVQHESIFYGLSKVAGVDLASEAVTLGTYPETSKTAIKTMLGVQDGLKVVRLI